MSPTHVISSATPDMALKRAGTAVTCLSAIAGPMLDLGGTC